MTEHAPRPHGNGWKSVVIGALGAIALAVGTWMLSEAATERRRIDDRVDQNRDRIATCEGSLRSLRESVHRLESEVEALRKRNEVRK